MPTVRSAVYYSALSKYSLSAIGLLSTILVARLLTPAEIGTFAIASAVVMLLGEVRLIGAGVFLVREKELTPDKIRSAMGLTMMMSWGLGLGLILAAPFIARFYDIAEIRLIFWILAVSFITAPFISMPAALLSRELKYNILFRIRLATALANLITTLTLIILGFSFYALAWGSALSMLIQSLITLYYAPANMVWKPRFRGLKPILRVGIFSSSANIAKQSQLLLPDLVLGRMGNTTQVALYSRGLGFIEFLSKTLVQGVSPVVLPYLSKINREGGSMTEAYTRASVLLSAIIWPVLAVASLVSLPAIRLFFGDQWDAAAPVASVLAFWAITRSVHAFFEQMMVSAGFEGSMVAKELVVFGLYLALIITAAPNGLVSIAWAMLVAAGIDAVLSTLILRKVLGLSAARFYRALMPNFILAFVCWLATWLLGLWVDFSSSAILVPIGTVAVVLPFVWLAGIKILRHPIYDEIYNIWFQLIARRRRDRG